MNLKWNQHEERTWEKEEKKLLNTWLKAHFKHALNKKNKVKKIKCLCARVYMHEKFPDQIAEAISV